MKSALLTAFVVLCVAVLVAGQLSFSKHGFEVEEGSPGFKSYSNEEVREFGFGGVEKFDLKFQNLLRYLKMYDEIMNRINRKKSLLKG